MLHLLPSALFSKILPFNKISERQFFLQRIILIVFLVHLFFFASMILFSSFSKKEDKFTILMHQAGATYVLMPLQKKIDQKNRSGSYKNSSVSKKSQVLNYEDYLEKKRSQKGRKNSMQAAKNPDIKKSLNFKKKTQKATMKLSSKSKSSAIALSLGKQSKNKKNKNHKKNKIKLHEEQHNHQKKVEDVTPEVEQQKPDSQELKSQEVKLQELTQEHQQQLNQDNDTQLSSMQETSLDDVIFVGYEQFDECVISSKIQQAVVASWTPPVGIDAGTACEMKVKVSAQGTADKVEIIKGSGILVYDTSARTALSQVEFPQEVYGKTIRIVLGN
jgi:hypothetical protein